MSFLSLDNFSKRSYQIICILFMLGMIISDITLDVNYNFEAHYHSKYKQTNNC